MALRSVPQQVKISPCFFHISCNLFAKGVDRGKLDLVAQAVEEADLNLGRWLQRNGMEVQQMSFNGKRIGAKRRAIADVGNGIELLLTDARAGDINAVFGHEFLVAR